MTKQQILEKAIRKARKNGYAHRGRYFQEWNIKNSPVTQGLIFRMLFSHRFAKAYFKKDWEKRLQEMVIESDPIKFLEKYQ